MDVRRRWYVPPRDSGNWGWEFAFCVWWSVEPHQKFDQGTLSCAGLSDERNKAGMACFPAAVGLLQIYVPTWLGVLRIRLPHQIRVSSVITEHQIVFLAIDTLRKYLVAVHCDRWRILTDPCCAPVIGMKLFKDDIRDAIRKHRLDLCCKLEVCLLVGECTRRQPLLAMGRFSVPAFAAKDAFAHVAEEQLRVMLVTALTYVGMLVSCGIGIEGGHGCDQPKPGGCWETQVFVGDHVPKKQTARYIISTKCCLIVDLRLSFQGPILSA
jgi:hypothetical protein